LIAVKRNDAWWTAFVIDPVAAPLAFALRDRPIVTPNRISAVSALVAVASAACFAAGALEGGALLFQLSFLLDCMDGKLAGLQGRTDPLGRMADVASDAVRVAFCSTGLAIALARNGEFVVDGIPLAAALVCLYVGVRTAVAAIAIARPAAGISAGGEHGLLEVEPSPRALLRVAPRRASAPGTTVDTETIAFTIGPLLGVPIVALAIAIATDMAYSIIYVLRAVRRVRRVDGSGAPH
jgi:phosphatidylglycerophosphate synthase